LEHPQKEEYRGNTNQVGPRSCYDEGKRAAETVLRDYKEFKGLSVSIARIFNTYGPRMNPNDGRVVSNFVVQALQGEDITIYGTGEQSRSFCYVDDLIDGMIALMNYNGPYPFPINVGNPNEFTMLELAEKVIQLTGTSSKIVYRELPQDDPRQRQPDIRRAKVVLDWEPTINLDAGLVKTIEYFKKVL
jgi:UDP-glucuronate decarboxylase